MASERVNIQAHKVGIIGAGVSGITAAKHLAHYNPLVFEATGSIGGVWRNCSYRTTKLQTRACEYEFSDFPWPKQDTNYFPSYAEILDYLHNYAVHFDVLKFVKFNSKVVEVRYIGDLEYTRSDVKSGSYGTLMNGSPAWEIAVQTDNSTTQWYSFEMLVMCVGKYGDVPRLPNFPPMKGPEVFNGKVLHSIEYCKLDKEEARDLVKGKKIVIIGYKKSAIDLAKECTEFNQGPDGQPLTMVVRSLHWVSPHYWIWGLPFHTMYTSRFGQFLWESPNEGALKTAASFLLSPIRKAFSKFVESYLLWKLPLEKYGLKPDHPFEEDYASCQMPMLPNNFFEEADKGNIKFKKAAKWWFYDGGVEFDDGTKLEADVVFLATGYEGRQKLLNLLPEPYSSLMVNSSGYLPLYRGTIHPLIPHTAFVGYIESLCNLMTGDLRCKWLARLADEQFKLPSIEKMLDEQNKEIEVLRRSTRFYTKQGIATFLLNRGDEMCKDMGLKAWRKKNLVLEAFSPYVGRDYAE